MLVNLTKECVMNFGKSGCEGLIIRGCGGDLNEWVDGINEMLTSEGILLNGTKLNFVAAFEDGKLTNLMFLFLIGNEGNIDMGKLAMWRLKTHEMLGGTWLSDYTDQNSEVC